METRELVKSDIEKIIKIKKEESKENGLTGNDLDEYLTAVKSFLENNLSIDFKMYGVLKNNELVAILSNTIIKRAIETLSVLGNMYTIPEYRNQGLQSHILIPYACKDNEKMRVITIELENNSKDFNISKHLSEEVLGLVGNLPFYQKNIDEAEFIVDETIQIETFGTSTFYYSITLPNQKVLLDAIVDISESMPSLCNKTGLKAYVNLSHRCAITPHEAFIYETLIISRILHSLKIMGVSSIQIDGSNIQERVLHSFGFTKKTNILRGQNIIFNMNNYQVLQKR